MVWSHLPFLSASLSLSLYSNPPSSFLARVLRILVCVTGVLGAKINPTTFTGVPIAPQSNRRLLPNLHQNREGHSSSTTGCPGPADTYKWVGRGSRCALKREWETLGYW